MARSLPPLNGLRAFEAAARHMSFTRAAEELSVTQAAVSHQVKALEARLGVQLFRRASRSLILTEDGQRYLPDVRGAFDLIATATTRLRKQDSVGMLTVSVTASFGSKWLVPRLPRFRELQPEIDVRVHAADELVDFSRGSVDMAIRYGRGNWPDLHAMELFNETFFPVCSPQLLAGPRPLREPSELRHHTLLHEDLMAIDWAVWLRTAGVQGVDPTRGPVFSHANMSLQAAADGQGVALGRSPLADDDLAAGRLVRLFEVSLPGDWAYHIVCPRATADRPKIVAFRDWLLAEVRGHASA